MKDNIIGVIGFILLSVGMTMDLQTDFSLIKLLIYVGLLAVLDFFAVNLRRQNETRTKASL